MSAVKTLDQTESYQAFVNGLAVASKQLQELTGFDESFAFAARSVHQIGLNDLRTHFHSKQDQIYVLDIHDDQNISGTAGIVINPINTRRLVSAILQEELSAEELDQQISDVIGELSNILINSCLVSLSQALERRLSGGVPYTKASGLDQLEHWGCQPHHSFILFEASFSNQEKLIQGDLHIVVGL